MGSEQPSAQPASARIRDALARARAALGEVGIESSAAEARTLVEHAAGGGPLVLRDELPADFEARCAQLVARRRTREPLQLILGWAPFRRLRLEVEPGVFIPRPETELVIDLVREHLDERASRVVDLCTGTGAIAAALLDEMPALGVTAVEIDPAAAALAARNLAAVGRERGRVLRADVRDASALSGLRGIDAVVSNPPYIPPGAIPRDVEVREHDPDRALYGGGADGLEVPAAVLARAAEMLRPGGLLVMEHADVQGPSARALAESTGLFREIRTHRDLVGRDRFLLAVRAPHPTSQQK